MGSVGTVITCLNQQDFSINRAWIKKTALFAVGKFSIGDNCKQKSKFCDVINQEIILWRERIFVVLKHHDRLTNIHHKFYSNSINNMY